MPAPRAHVFQHVRVVPAYMRRFGWTHGFFSVPHHTRHNHDHSHSHNDTHHRPQQQQQQQQQQHTPHNNTPRHTTTHNTQQQPTNQTTTPTNQHTQQKHSNTQQHHISFFVSFLFCLFFLSFLSFLCLSFPSVRSVRSVFSLLVFVSLSCVFFVFPIVSNDVSCFLLCLCFFSLCFHGFPMKKNKCHMCSPFSLLVVSAILLAVPFHLELHITK